MTRLAVGKHDLVEAATWSAAQPADVIGDAEQARGDVAKLTAAFHQPISIGIGFEVVDSFHEGHTCLLRQMLCDMFAKARMRIDARSDRRAAGWQLKDCGQRSPCPIAG